MLARMTPRLVTILVLSISSLLFGSCASSGRSTFSYSHVFQAQHSISVVNNTTVLLDIEINGENVARNLAPGATYHWPIYSFRRGDIVSVVVKGHQDDTFVGMADKSFRLYSSSSSGRRSEVWEVKRLSQPQAY